MTSRYDGYPYGVINLCGERVPVRHMGNDEWEAFTPEVHYSNGQKIEVELEHGVYSSNKKVHYGIINDVRACEYDQVLTVILDEPYKGRKEITLYSGDDHFKIIDYIENKK